MGARVMDSQNVCVSESCQINNYTNNVSTGDGLNGQKMTNLFNANANMQFEFFNEQINVK
jgi:hypothetical protein